MLSYYFEIGRLFRRFSLLDLREKANLASKICFHLDFEALAMTDRKEICMIVSMRDQNISVQWWQYEQTHKCAPNPTIKMFG